MKKTAKNLMLSRIYGRGRGTSLLKVFAVVERFSEDIDLILNWDALSIRDEII